MAKTNTGLVAYAKAQVGKPYWYGTFGNFSTEELYYYKKAQYPSQYRWALPSSQLGKRVHDCVGLIKGYLWSATNTAVPKYNAKQDVSANGMLQACKEKGRISTMPDLPGVLVFLPGHVGVYIGNGEVVEAKGHDYGVVISKLKGRGWQSWGKCPWITYENVSVSKPTVTVPKRTVDEVARSVINGDYGVGEDRVKRLTAAGYDAKAVQKRVNEILAAQSTTKKKSDLEIAKEVIDGKWGNGKTRKKKLEAAGYNYKTIQEKVNWLLK
jgi:hypothetical protein